MKNVLCFCLTLLLCSTAFADRGHRGGGRGGIVRHVTADHGWRGGGHYDGSFRVGYTYRPPTYYYRSVYYYPAPVYYYSPPTYYYYERPVVERPVIVERSPIVVERPVFVPTATPALPPPAIATPGPAATQPVATTQPTTEDAVTLSPSPAVKTVTYQQVSWRGRIYLYHQTGYRLHQHGGDKGQLDWIEGVTADGHAIKIEFGAGGEVKKVKD